MACAQPEHNEKHADGDEAIGHRILKTDRGGGAAADAAPRWYSPADADEKRVPCDAGVPTWYAVGRAIIGATARNIHASAMASKAQTPPNTR